MNWALVSFFSDSFNATIVPLENKRNTVKEYGVNTFYSVFSDEESGTDVANVHWHYKSSKAFADKMAADKFLD